MNSVGIFLLAVVAVAPVVCTGVACTEIGEHNRMQEIAYEAAAARRKRWAHL